MAKPAKNETKGESSKKNEFNFGYYLYEGGTAHWQCNNIIVGGAKGYPISKEDALKSGEDRKAQWQTLEDERLAKTKKTDDAAEQ